MDSIKSFKGYGKVDEAEERAFRQKTRRRLIIISVSVIVLVTVIIAAVVGIMVHKNNTESSSSSPRITPVESIKAVCSVTQYPESCFSSISSLDNPSGKTDPEEIFKLSLKAAINEVSKLTSLPDKFMNKKSKVVDGVNNALIDCKTLIDDSIDQLNSSISSMEVHPDQDLLSTIKINNIKTWLSSVITNQETCLDGLIEMKSTFVDQVKIAMKNSTELTSNSLSIVSKILTILGNFNIPIHRKLLGRVDSEFPEWVNPRDRRLLDEVKPRPDLTVASDGSGDFKTIKEAIEVVKKKNETRVIIYVKEGKYMENVIIDKGHWNIMMYGDGKDKTIISGSLNNRDGIPTFSSATFARGSIFLLKALEEKSTREREGAVVTLREEFVYPREKEP